MGKRREISHYTRCVCGGRRERGKEEGERERGREMESVEGRGRERGRD